jgi:apolipoprotein N-acyltransferase
LSPKSTTPNTALDSAKAIQRPPLGKRQRVFALAMASMAILWLAFPPVGLAWLSWFALCPLIWLIESKALNGRRPYLQLYTAGLIFWLATFYFIPIPHPALWLGWLMVSAYMAIYTPLSIGLARSLVHRYRIPSVIAIPVVWTGIEWFRSNFATGMAMVCLSHTQYRQPILIQVADIFGAYTLTFVIALVSVGLTALFKFYLSGKQRNHSIDGQAVAHVAGSKKRLGATMAVATATFIATLVYGQIRLTEQVNYKNESQLAIGLIQTNDDVIFRQKSSAEYEDRLQRKIELTRQARAQWADLELIVWPESGFSPYADLLSDASPNITVELAASRRREVWCAAIGYPSPNRSPVPLLTGGTSMDPENSELYGSAFLIGNDGLIESRYYKNHLVMFGEYVPLSNWFPIIKKLSPIGGGINAGTEPVVITKNEINLSPNICFESTVPHFIRWQVNTLAKQGQEPDVLINMTNDGWFFGTSCLDLHLACNVFRAVEMRKTSLVCANTGLSAEIDPCGRLLQTGGRREANTIRADVRAVQRPSLYRTMGDIVPMIMLIIATALGSLDYCQRKLSLQRQ